MTKKILDVTCGSRTIWFNKNHPAAIYCDVRDEECTGVWKSTNRDSERACIVHPDVLCDFADLPFPDNSFAWDLMIAHPPCTYLTSAGSMRLIRIDPSGGKWINAERYYHMREAAKFFEMILRADIPMICVENPAPMHICELPKYSQIIQPYMFGHPYTKRTCLWLKNLLPLEPTQVVTPKARWVDTGHGRTTRTKLDGLKLSAKDRSKTFPGIAKAMAEQWGGDIREKA